MKNQILTAGCVDYQFEIKVSETTIIHIWVQESICMGCLLQGNQVYSFSSPVKIQESEKVHEVATDMAVSLITEYFREQAYIAIISQINEQDI